MCRCILILFFLLFSLPGMICKEIVSLPFAEIVAKKTPLCYCIEPLLTSLKY